MFASSNKAKTCQDSTFADEIGVVIDSHPIFTLTPTFGQIVAGRLANRSDQVTPARNLSACLLIKIAKNDGAQISQQAAGPLAIMTKNLGPG